MSSLHKNLELGREKLGQGDYLGALAHADAALAIDASSFEALQLRSRTLYLLGRDAEALQTLKQVHAVLQKILIVPPAYTTDSYFGQDSAPEDTVPDGTAFGTDALETLLALREHHKLDADLLSLLAELSEDAGRYELARDAYYELVAVEPSRLQAWEGLVHVLCHEDLDAALTAIARALELFPTHALFYEFLGFIYFRRRHYRKALVAYRQAIENGTEQLDNFQALIECYIALDDIDAAMDVVKLISQHGINDVDSHRFIIEVALQCEKFDVAMEHAHQLVRLQPSHAETYCYKAWVELASGDWPAAERTLRLGFHKAVDGAFALFELVEVLITDGEFEDALRVAELAGELAPDHPESSASRGKVLREMGLFSEASEAFQQSIVLAPQDDAYQTWMGIVQDNLGEYHEALERFNHVLSRHPTDVWTLSNRGLTYLAMDDDEKALADFTRGIEIDPQDAQLYFWRGCAQVKLGYHDKAFFDLHRAVDLSDDIYGWLDQEPILLQVRDDPRFDELFHGIRDEG